MNKFRYFVSRIPETWVKDGEFSGGDSIMGCSESRHKARQLNKAWLQGKGTIMQFEAKPPYKFVKVVT